MFFRFEGGSAVASPVFLLFDPVLSPFVGLDGIVPRLPGGFVDRVGDSDGAEVLLGALDDPGAPAALLEPGGPFAMPPIGPLFESVEGLMVIEAVGGRDIVSSVEYPISPSGNDACTRSEGCCDPGGGPPAGRNAKPGGAWMPCMPGGKYMAGLAPNGIDIIPVIIGG